MEAELSADAFIARLEIVRRAEKEQSMAYRSLAALAEGRGDLELAQRFHDLHADEQHHLSRLTARILEFGGRPVDLEDVSTPAAGLGDWQSYVRNREMNEIERYTELLAMKLDDTTRSLIEDIAAVEAHHLADLGGKWTLA